MKTRIIGCSALLFLSMFAAIPSAQAQEPEVPNWSIGWVEDNSEPVMFNSRSDPNSNDWWDKSGFISLEFYIENNRVTEINIGLVAENDHEDEFTWVDIDLDESVTVPGQSNKSFSFSIEAGSLNDVNEGSIHGLKIIAQEESLLPTTPQDIEADTKVPRVAVMTADIIDEDIPLMAGSSVEMKVQLTNLGNKNDELVNSETNLVIDGCPQLSADTDTSLFATVEPEASKEGFFEITASSSHPSKSCIIKFNSQSVGFASVADSIELEVKSSSSTSEPSNSNGGNNGDGGDGSTDDTDPEDDEGLRGNFLNALSLPTSLMIIASAAFIRRKSRHLSQ